MEAGSSDVGGALQLADFLEALRGELTAAQSMRRDELQLQIETMTVELNLAASHGMKGKGGVKFWVVNAGVEADSRADSYQRVTLQIRLVGSDGLPILINDLE